MGYHSGISRTIQEGKLVYVLGSCQETQHSIVAIILSQPHFTKTLETEEQLKEPIHKWHMEARKATFQKVVAQAKLRFMVLEEEEDRIAETTRHIKGLRSEIRRTVVSLGERITQLADLKRVEEEETAWSISEKQTHWPCKAGKASAPHLWVLAEYEETHQVF